MPMKVAVIGAGPSGMMAARHMSLYPDEFTIVGFEKAREVGGLWNYSDYTDTDEYGLPCYSSVYKSLRINVPVSVMRFQDEPFQGGIASFTTHTEVKKYLDHYAKKYDLNKYFRFQTLVTNVKPCTSTEGTTTWLVTSRNLKNNEFSTETFDAVMVANGHEIKPHYPKFPGAEKFKGRIIHTKNHRDNENYRGKTVLVVGASFSVQDMIFELAPVVPKLYVSHRLEKPLPFKLPDNVYEVPLVKEIYSNGVVLANGEVKEVDDIIYGTGFEYHIPFLDPACNVVVKDSRVQPVHLHMRHIEFPTLWFIGLVKAVVQFQMSYAQAHYAVAALRGKLQLPSKAEMYREEEESYQNRVVKEGLPAKFTHDQGGPYFRQYVERLAKDTNYKSVKEGALKFFDHYCHVIVNEYGTLKQRTYELVGEDDFTETMGPGN